ncbi:polysaccharide lyase family 7 protein [Flavobacterium sp. ASW18X]|uniref:polysaccharide lyase family 7 protein n=1 Tax=Flavobacterium sp. ASW18X TaxID=2572595 RepID=UPI0010ADFE16|nr:polysaccharide lyase family 7 protein [Flavobacterium sp. ASW18X]TKD62523.1 polysaccharide lyase family 7 protein [Flavobacterium sp. ASW18X]
MRFSAFILSFLTLTLTLLVNSQEVAINTTTCLVKEKPVKKKKKYRLPKIDLSHWKVTIPTGKPDEVTPPEIKDYATIEKLKPFMYTDSTDGSIVFHAIPNKTTANTKYSRTELREQMEPGSNHVNWTFAEGGALSGTMRMDAVSKAADGKYHKVIIMQIHGRLTNEQRDLIGQKDNNAPPILKIYWDNGKIRVKTKVLKVKGLSGDALLHESVWGDDEGRNFEEKVNFDKFKLEVKVTDGKMVVSLNKNEYFVYDDINIKKWGIFENYFKAGNYLQTRDDGAFAKVKIYQLNVSH